MYSGSRAKLPTSAYAMSNQLASRIGYWDAGPEAIGEDLHVSFFLTSILALALGLFQSRFRANSHPCCMLQMAVKAWFETAGELHVEAIYCRYSNHAFVLQLAYAL